MEAIGDPANVRILTTLGHVDHGKTTLMDSLLAANNIISSRMAGKMRYLDSREDEQERGITMEASAVSLKFQVLGGPDRTPISYVVNMIDTPGHVDFSSEVSTASRLCDGALVLVDVVEGVCTQTIAVLRQSWSDKLKPILVINKFDRLITELQLSPVEAYQHLSRLIEQVNAVMGSFFAGERMEDDLRWREEREERLNKKKEQLADETDATINDAEDEYLEKDDEDIYFAPEKGNVVFASAIHGWGFRVGKFAQLYSAKLKMKEANLRRVLWGDYYIDPKTKRVISYKHLRGRSLKPLFVQFVLDNIWAVYDAVMLNPNPEKTVKITATLNVKIAPRDMKSKDARHLLTLILSQWLSLSTSIIQTAIDIVPPPKVAQQTRIPRMLHPESSANIIEPKTKAERDLYSSAAEAGSFCCAYVSKMFAVAAKDLPIPKKQALTASEMRARPRAATEKDTDDVQPVPDAPTPVDETDEVDPEPANAETANADVLLGFARLYCGTIKTGSTLYAVLPKYDTSLDPSNPRNSKLICSIKVEGLYVMMGRELITVETVVAGNIFAVKGLEGKVWRSATLCAPGEAGIDPEKSIDESKEYLTNLGGVAKAAAAIVRIAVEPAMPADLPKMIKGLELLSQSDPCVETLQQQTGEYVIVGAGELHLERCLRDLRDRFANVEIQASKPIVPFRETAVKASEMLPSKAENGVRGTCKGVSAQGIVKFSVRAVPLPREILDFVLENTLILKRLQRNAEGNADHDEDVEGGNVMGDVIRKSTVKPDQFWEALSEICKTVGGEWAAISTRIWAFGPRQAGGCLLIDSRPGEHQSLQTRLSGGAEVSISNFDGNIEAGFQFASFQGPLCSEPVEGMAYFVETVEVDQDALQREIEQNRVSQISGSVITAMRDACRNGLLDWSPRLMLAMYACDIQASTDVLGKVYSVVAQRKGRIVSEEMKEGTSFFTVSALLPVVESFGFSDDIRKRTSGAASPQLIFSGYELLDQDPFWVPTTEEELEDLGEKGDRANIAKGYMDGVRERKGLFVDRKIVEFAEKQRTLKR